MSETTQRRTPPGRLRRATALLVLTLVLCAALTGCYGSSGGTSPAPTGGTRSMGVFLGGSNPATMPPYESWVGRRMGTVKSFFSKSSWASFQESSQFIINQWKGRGYAVEYSVPMLVDNDGGTLAAGNSGRYDGQFRSLAQKLVAGGQGNATLRLGWEFNGGWFKWSALSNPSAYASYWRRIVTAMRSVRGAGGLRFEWTPGIGASYVPTAAYPGDAYVTYIGMDVYDRCYSSKCTNPQWRWNDYVNRPYGLRWHRDFARAHGKAMTFPEWGVTTTHPRGSTGDNPYFIQQMRNWIYSNNVHHFSYFEYNGGGGYYGLRSGRFPNAARAFQNAF